MDLTRRDLLKTGVSAAVLAALPRSVVTRLGAKLAVPPIVDPDVRELALRAVDAARRAGATYADVRLTHTRQRNFYTAPAGGGGGTSENEEMVVGVRALVDGYWGFASGPVWTKDEMDRLGQEAVHQAKANTLGKSRVVELASTPVVRDGHWVTPVELDPFEVSPFEILDFLDSLVLYMERKGGPTRLTANFQVQEKAFASTEGSFCTQRLYLSGGTASVNVGPYPCFLDTLMPASVGWELWRGQPMRELLLQLLARVRFETQTPWKPLEVGRYDTVCDAAIVAHLLNGTLGPATELDRALAYEANASGTSYLTDPSGMLGSYHVGAPGITLTSNRTERGGAATVQWDDEGVTPADATLVKDGVLTDFQTMRESATWLAEQYRARSMPVRSQGCANAPSALDAPLQHAPNLRLAPGAEAADFESFMKGIGKGIAVVWGSPPPTVVAMDSQALNGYLSGMMFQVSAGKRVSRLIGPAILFRAPELWKGVAALGGEASVRRYGLLASKGEPAQQIAHSVTAPPAMFKQLTLIEAGRK